MFLVHQHELRMRKRGFTLIELLVVVAIIALLAALLMRMFERASLPEIPLGYNLRFALRPVLCATLGVTGLQRQRGARIEQLDDAVIERVDASANFLERVAHCLNPFFSFSPRAGSARPARP